MAITYHSGERIQGATTPATATFSDDFTDSQSILDARWISDFSLLQADATNDNLKANVEAGSSLSECVYDFGLVSETKWIIDFDWDVTAFTAYSTGGSAPDLYVLMSSDNDSDTYTGDLVGIRLRTYASALELQYGNGVALNASTDVSFSESASVLGIRYWRFKRTSATSFTATFYSTSADRSAETNAVESLTATISSSYTGLRYFGVFASNNGSGTGSIDSTIDNVKIYDGITTVNIRDTKPTNVPDGSRFEETDTRKFYTKDVNGWKEKGTALEYRHDSTYEQINPFTTINKQHFVEWFSGKQLPDYWTTSTFGGSIIMNDALDGGVKLYTTGTATNSNFLMHFNNKRQYSETGSVCIFTISGDIQQGVATNWFLNVGLARITGNTGHWLNIASGETYFRLGTSQSETHSYVTTDVSNTSAWTAVKIENKSSSAELTLNGILKATATSGLQTSSGMQPSVYGNRGTSGSAGSNPLVCLLRYMECYNT